MKIGDQVICIDAGLEVPFSSGAVGSVASVVSIPGGEEYVTFVPDLHEGAYVMRASRFVLNPRVKNK